MGGLGANSFFLERYAEGVCPYNDGNLTYWKVWSTTAATYPVRNDHHLNINTPDQLHPGEEGVMGIPEINTTTVSFTSSDGVKLIGEYAGGHKCGPVVVMLHGNGMCL